MRVRSALLIGLAATAAVALGCGGGSAERKPADRAAAPQTRIRASDVEALGPRLQNTLDGLRSHEGIPGAAAAVVIRGKVAWSGASGEADRSAHRPATARTLFAVGSITKTFVAALMLKLAEHGVLNLDDHLSRWVPEFPNSHRITLRQLLNHTSGTANFVENPAFARAQKRNPNLVWTPERTLRYAQHPFEAPGQEWRYSNTNYILAGLVIERATRSTVGRELHRLLLHGRQFRRIVLQGDERPQGPVAVGYENVDADPALEPTPNNGYIPSKAEATAAWTAGGMLASAADLARAGDGIFRGSLLTDRSRHEMTRFVNTLVRDPPGYGLGLARTELGGETVWAHSGDIYGFHAELAYIPKLQATVAALDNYQDEAPGQDLLIDSLISDVRVQLSAR